MNPLPSSPLSPKDVPSATSFHPEFNSSDTDVVLSAKNASCLFRVHSHTLKLTSGFFRTMFSLPQTNPTNSETIYLDEEADILAHLLRMACGLVLLPIDSYDLVDSILHAAEKYDMPGPMSMLRVLVMTPTFLQDPLRLYAVASRYAWDDEAKFASTQTLSHDIFDESHRNSLLRLSSTALLDLILLHRSRKQRLQEQLNHPPFVSGGSAICIQCHGTMDYRTWRELKYKMIMEIDHRPLGDTILDTGLDNWPEAIACWEAQCPNIGCDRYLYDKLETIRVIRTCIEQLPSSITSIK